MDLSQGGDPMYRFGSFEVDPTSGELRKNGARVKLQEQPFQLLLALLEKAGEVVSREELQQRLWAADTFVEFDAGVRVAVRKLRDALGDDAESPRYVETIPKRGYRFVAPVSRGEGLAAAIPPARRRLHGASLAMLAALALGIAVGLSVLAWRSSRGAPPAASRIGTLVVLPLENLSQDPEQEYFAEGMTEELTAELGRIRSLRVISHTSARQYKNARKPLRQIARELNVDGVIEGSVLQSGDKVRITVQLIEAGRDTHLWSESYERDLRDVLTLQREVAGAIAQQVSATLTPRERTRLAAQTAVSPEAHEAYLKGRYYLAMFTEEGSQKAITFFNRALQLQPDYALAYAALSEAYYQISSLYLAPSEVMPKARAASEKALQLDDSLPDGHLSLANVLVYYDWEFEEGEKEFRRAIELDPNSAPAHTFYAQYLACDARFAEASSEFGRALQLDPVSRATIFYQMIPFYFSRQYDEALTRIHQVAELAPDFSFGPWGEANIHIGQGRFEQAIAELQKIRGLDSSPEVLGYLGYAYAASGQSTQAMNVIRDLRQMEERRYVSPADIGLIYAALGDKNQAFAWLEKAYRDRDEALLWIKVEYRFDPLRQDPRFQDLERRIGLH